MIVAQHKRYWSATRWLQPMWNTFQLQQWDSEDAMLEMIKFNYIVLVSTYINLVSYPLSPVITSQSGILPTLSNSAKSWLYTELLTGLYLYLYLYVIYVRDVNYESPTVTDKYVLDILNPGKSRYVHRGNDKNFQYKNWRQSI